MSITLVVPTLQFPVALFFPDNFYKDRAPLPLCEPQSRTPLLQEKSSQGQTMIKYCSQHCCFLSIANLHHRPLQRRRMSPHAIVVVVVVTSFIVTPVHVTDNPRRLLVQDNQPTATPGDSPERAGSRWFHLASPCLDASGQPTCRTSPKKPGPEKEKNNYCESANRPGFQQMLSENFDRVRWQLVETYRPPP